MNRTGMLLVLALACSAGLGLAALGSVRFERGCCSACPSKPAVAQPAPAPAVTCAEERLEAVGAPVLAPAIALEPAVVAEHTSAASPAPVALHAVSSATSAQSVAVFQAGVAPVLSQAQQQALAARRIQREHWQQKSAVQPLAAKPGSVQAARLPKPDPMAQALAGRRKHSGQPSQLDELQQKAAAAGVQAVRPAQVK